MGHVISRALVGTAVLASLLAAPALAAAAPSLQGLNINAHWLPEWNGTINAADELRLADDSGARWVRMSISWNALEASGVRAYEEAGSEEARALGRVERAVEGARARGLRVLLFVDSTPAWANGQGSYAADLPPTDPHHADYAAFVGRMAGRFRDRVGAWQIWNEPNLPRFWRSTDASAYGRLVSTTAPQVRGGDPAALVISAGLSPDGSDPYEFLGRAMKAGMAGAIDHLGLHAYPGSTPELCRRRADGRLVHKDFCAVDGLVDEARVHQPGISAWVTEIGWSSYDRPGWGNQSSEADQAAYLTRADALMSASGRVDRAFWYGLHDLGSDRFSWDDNLGLTRGDYSPKPSFEAFAAVSRGERTQPPPPAPSPATTEAAGSGDTSDAGDSGNSRKKLGGRKGRITLSAKQLGINQRIGQAAIRRLNAVEARLDGKPAPSTDKNSADGGEISLSAKQLGINQRIYQAGVRKANSLEARFAGRRALNQPKKGALGKVTLSIRQLGINQKIAQAAVRRANELERRVS